MGSGVDCRVFWECHIVGDRRLQLKELTETIGWGEEKGSPFPDVKMARACSWQCGGQLPVFVFSLVEDPYKTPRP